MEDSVPRLVIIGRGSVSQCALPLFIEFFLRTNRIRSILIIDAVHRTWPIENHRIQCRVEKIDKNNFRQILSEHLSIGDVLVDLAVNLETRDLLEWCHEHRVNFLNTSVELWNPFALEEKNDPRLLTLYHRQMEIVRMKFEQKWTDRSPTAVLDHGCNPGLVSHFVKRALNDMARFVLREKRDILSFEQEKSIRQAIDEKDFPRLAFLLDIKTIHISERDTQISRIPKNVNEFVNTWSIDGLVEEAVAPAEIGWGTHEKQIPDGALFHDPFSGPCNQICLKTRGMNTWVNRTKLLRHR